MRIKFTHMIFYVKDVLETLKFFEKAFDVETVYLHEGNVYGVLATEGVSLAFASEELANMNLEKGFLKHQKEALPQACEIVFSTDQPEELYKKALKAGASEVAAPQQKPWGQTVAYVRDPNGILIEIASDMA